MFDAPEPLDVHVLAAVLLTHGMSFLYNNICL